MPVAISGKTIYGWAKHLFPYNRSLTGEGNLKTFKFIKNKLKNLKLLKFPTNKKVFDWKVPYVWNVKDAYLANHKNFKIVDFKKNNLHLVGYSHPVNKNVSFKELEKHLHYIKKQPNAIPYITSYYKKYWGFCLSYKQFKKLNKNKDYYVRVQSSFKKGFMHVGEILIKGRSKKEILLSTNICHPSMGNNELSGLVTTMAITKYLQSKKILNYSYRILFLPETIGSISYINKNLAKLRKNTIGGLNIVCTGDEGDFSFLPSKYQNSLFEKIALNTLKKYIKNVKKYSFLDRGSDERQYCSPGINLPVCSIMRSKYGKYKEYHTSLDNLKFISAKGLGKSYKIIKLFLAEFENTKIYINTNMCEPFLSKYNLYPTISDKKSFQNTKLIKNILTYCDGKNDVSAISKLIKENEKKVNKVLKILIKKKLIRQL
tara:strand:- start:20045 stop:21334 length:1290 start_codon:yes stop_codon:yes gene_type:complete